MRGIGAAVCVLALSGFFQFGGNGRAGAMPDRGAPGAESRGFRFPLPFLPLVLAAGAGDPVEKLVLSDARRAGQPAECWSGSLAATARWHRDPHRSVSTG
jgi:hypothetical protein